MKHEGRIDCVWRHDFASERSVCCDQRELWAPVEHALPTVAPQFVLVRTTSAGKQDHSADAKACRSRRSHRDMMSRGSGEQRALTNRSPRRRLSCTSSLSTCLSWRAELVT